MWPPEQIRRQCKPHIEPFDISAFPYIFTLLRHIRALRAFRALRVLGCEVVEPGAYIEHVEFAEYAEYAMKTSDNTFIKNMNRLTKKYGHAGLLIEKKCVTLRRLYVSVTVGIEILAVAYATIFQIAGDV